MQVLAAVQKLEHDALHGSWRDWMSCWLGVVMDDLQEIVLCIFEDHKDTFVLKDNLVEADDIYMTQLGTKGHLPDC